MRSLLDPKRNTDTVYRSELYASDVCLVYKTRRHRPTAARLVCATLLRRRLLVKPRALIRIHRATAINTSSTTTKLMLWHTVLARPIHRNTFAGLTPRRGRCTMLVFAPPARRCCWFGIHLHRRSRRCCGARGGATASTVARGGGSGGVRSCDETAAANGGGRRVRAGGAAAAAVADGEGRAVLTSGKGWCDVVVR